MLSPLPFAGEGPGLRGNLRAGVSQKARSIDQERPPHETPRLRDSA